MPVTGKLFFDIHIVKKIVKSLSQQGKGNEGGLRHLRCRELLFQNKWVEAAALRASFGPPAYLSYLSYLQPAYRKTIFDPPSESGVHKPSALGTVETRPSRS
jgi:hypothetical protein